MTVHEVLNEISNDIQFNEQLFRAGYLSQGQFMSNLNWLLSQREAVLSNNTIQWDGHGLPASMGNYALDSFVAEYPTQQSQVGDVGVFPAIVRIFVVFVVLGLVIALFKR